MLAAGFGYSVVAVAAKHYACFVAVEVDANGSQHFDCPSKNKMVALQWTMKYQSS